MYPLYPFLEFAFPSSPPLPQMAEPTLPHDRGSFCKLLLLSWAEFSSLRALVLRLLEAVCGLYETCSGTHLISYFSYG